MEGIDNPIKRLFGIMSGRQVLNTMSPQHKKNGKCLQTVQRDVSLFLHVSNNATEFLQRYEKIKRNQNLSTLRLHLIRNINRTTPLDKKY